MKLNKCLECNKKVNPNAKWCNSECKKKFLLSHYSEKLCIEWFKNDKFEQSQEKDDIKEKNNTSSSHSQCLECGKKIVEKYKIYDAYFCKKCFKKKTKENDAELMRGLRSIGL